MHLVMEAHCRKSQPSSIRHIRRQEVMWSKVITLIHSGQGIDDGIEFLVDFCHTPHAAAVMWHPPRR
jgi:hypothetical protein